MRTLRNKAVLAAAMITGVAAFASSAQASDTLFQQYIGDYGISTSGWGSITDSGTISTSAIAAGSTVTAAYLYTSTYDENGSSIFTPSGTLNGTTLNYTGLGVNVGEDCCDLEAFRADVTSTVSAAINGGAGGVYNFSITEAPGQNTSAGQDGEALVVVYSNPDQATQTIAILDGSASSTGDNSSINFSTPLNPSAPGFFAHMAIGDGFSCCDQESTIDVNGQAMTTVAGNNDSSVDGSDVSNGNLITVGNINGPYTGGTPGDPQTDYDADHEAYDLAPFVNNGDTSINLTTINASEDDNIFLEAFDVSGVANVITSGVPEPSTWAMFLLGFGAIGWTLRRRREASAATT
jgi:hypothetical protein